MSDEKRRRLPAKLTVNSFEMMIDPAFKGGAGIGTIIQPSWDVSG